MLAGVVALSGGLAAGVGPWIRGAGLIVTASEADSASLEFADAPGEARAFFRSRDRLTIRVPWNMTRREFLTLYHLENAAAAAEALDRMGRRTPDDLLAQGDTVSIPLLIPEAMQ